MYTYIYIYIERERGVHIIYIYMYRERETEMYMYIYIYIERERERDVYIYIYIYILPSGTGKPPRRFSTEVSCTEVGKSNNKLKTLSLRKLPVHKRITQEKNTWEIQFSRHQISFQRSVGYWIALPRLAQKRGVFVRGTDMKQLPRHVFLVLQSHEKQPEKQ